MFKHTHNSNNSDMFAYRNIFQTIREDGVLSDWMVNEESAWD